MLAIIILVRLEGIFPFHEKIQVHNNRALAIDSNSNTVKLNNLRW